MLLLFLISIGVLSFLFDILSKFQKKIIKGLDYEKVRGNALSLFDETDIKSETFKTQFHDLAEVDFIAAVSGHGVGYFQTYCHYDSSLWSAILEYFEKGNKGSFCVDYQFTWWYIQFLSTAITVFVQVINFVIKSVVQQNVIRRGLPSRTDRTYATFIDIFAHAFLNTGFSQMIANAEFKGTPLFTLFWWIPKSGTFRDMSTDWFKIIGPKLVMSAFILTLNPQIDWAILELPRWMGINKDVVKIEAEEEG